MIDNILNAGNYQKFCDFSFIPSVGIIDDFTKKGGNIFCKTDYVLDLFNLLQNSHHTYNLITHHSDFPITEELFSQKPGCIKKWLGINPTFKAEELIAIPLGIKTHLEPYLEPQYMSEWFIHNIPRLKTIHKTNNIYCNWNVTNLDRNLIIEKLKQNNLKYTHDYNKPFYHYIENMASHKFVISPPGNGIDCHRTWEALYVGCIPIVIKHPIYNNWTDLPILQVEDYSEINSELLDDFYRKPFNYEMLSIEFWKNIVK
jgi:hypothetical protein